MSENQKNPKRPYQKPNLTEINLKSDQLFQLGCKITGVKGNQGDATRFCKFAGQCSSTEGT